MFIEFVCKKVLVALQANSIIDNIANKCSFSLRMLSSPKHDEKAKEHVRMKKAIHPKDGIIFNFMIRLPNDELEIAESSLLVVSELEAKGCNNTNGETTQAEFDFVKTLLRDNCVEGYTLSPPSDNISDLFPLTRNSLSHCPLCDWEHNSENAYIIRKNKIYRFYCHRANQDREPGM